MQSAAEKHSGNRKSTDNDENIDTGAVARNTEVKKNGVENGDSSETLNIVTETRPRGVAPELPLAGVPAIDRLRRFGSFQRFSRHGSHSGWLNASRLIARVVAGCVFATNIFYLTRQDRRNRTLFLSRGHRPPADLSVQSRGTMERSPQRTQRGHSIGTYLIESASNLPSTFFGRGPTVRAPIMFTREILSSTYTQVPSGMHILHLAVVSPCDPSWAYVANWPHPNDTHLDPMLGTCTGPAHYFNGKWITACGTALQWQGVPEPIRKSFGISVYSG